MNHSGVIGVQQISAPRTARSCNSAASAHVLAALARSRGELPVATGIAPGGPCVPNGPRPPRAAERLRVCNFKRRHTPCVLQELLPTSPPSREILRRRNPPAEANVVRSKPRLACTFIAEAGIGSRPGGTKGPAQNLWPRLHFVADWRQLTGTARPQNALKRSVLLRLKLAAATAGCGGITILCGLCLTPRRAWFCSGRRLRGRRP